MSEYVYDERADCDDEPLPVERDEFGRPTRCEDCDCYWDDCECGDDDE